MKLQSKVFFLSCAAMVISSLGMQQKQPAFAEPYPEGKYPVADDLVKQKIVPPQTVLSINDYLIDLAKAGDVNFIADVTSIAEGEVQPFPATPMAKYNPWEPKLYLTILDLTQQYRLSQLWYDPSTFLFWKEPDAAQLARLLIRETARDPDGISPNAIDLYHIVTKGKDLLMDFPAEGKVVDIPLRELPSEQCDRALALIRQLFIGGQRLDRGWFSNAFWKNATIRLSTAQHDDKTVPILQVLGRDRQISLSGGLLGLQGSAGDDINQTEN